MNARAVIFDVYNTLLDVGEAPADADARWRALFREFLGSAPPLDREGFAVRARQIVAQHHAEARTRGISWPEVHWPTVVSAVLPAISRLSPAEYDDFLFRQMQVMRAVRLANGAAECLRQLHENRVLLGIASNAQAYTLRELDHCLGSAGLDRSLFESGLCFWSFEHGFSKPDPHVFQFLTARLAARGIGPAATLMIGDRLDNDIQPAMAFGWQTWQRRAAPEAGTAGGDLRQLLETWEGKHPDAVV